MNEHPHRDGVYDFTQDGKTVEAQVWLDDGVMAFHCELGTGFVFNTTVEQWGEFKKEL